MNAAPQKNCPRNVALFALWNRPHLVTPSLMANLALVMIVRNEARCIERCLSSARTQVDTMLVLDTGSDDDTVERARGAGARVAHFPWCDDFAAARNAALEEANADWSLVLDADEWIADGAASLQALRAVPRYGPAG